MRPIDSFQVDEPADLELFEKLLNAPRPNVSATALRAVRLLVLDFDGVMTDNRVILNEDGMEAVCCNRSDGFGLARLRELGVEVLVITSERVGIAKARCRKLGIVCVSGCHDKLSTLKSLVAERSLEPAQVAYVGNDLNDLDCMKWVGISIAVNDALAAVRAVASVVTRHSGGFGAVREVCDLIQQSRSEGAGK
jgi:YrbI family 3-deoxy-D-manno-octulosonate 8-phosphate phosphatase